MILVSPTVGSQEEGVSYERGTPAAARTHPGGWVGKRTSRLSGQAIYNSFEEPLQRYLAHKKIPPHRTLQ